MPMCTTDDDVQLHHETGGAGSQRLLPTTRAACGHEQPSFLRLCYRAGNRILSEHRGGFTVTSRALAQSLPRAIIRSRNLRPSTDIKLGAFRLFQAAPQVPAQGPRSGYQEDREQQCPERLTGRWHPRKLEQNLCDHRNDQC